MATPVETKTIKGRAYACTRLPATRASALLFLLTSRFGDALVRSLSTLTDLSRPSMEFIVPLVARVDPADLQDSVLRLLETVRAEGESGTCKDCADAHFGYDILGMYEVALWALTVQFGPIFAVVAAQLEKLQAMTAAKTHDQATG